VASEPVGPAPNPGPAHAAGEQAVHRRDGLPIVAFASAGEWGRWLSERHTTSKGVWVKLAKKDTGIETVTYDEAVELALAYGWIDGQKGRFDERHWLQRFTRRGPRSRWSQINRDRATALIERGALKPSGLREVERAQADGRWAAAYAGQRTASVPDDLRAALDAHDGARAFFETLNGANRYAILYRIQDAGTADTRARRIAKYVAMCAEGRTIHP
jgi:uncharacterized protein YdeI (YjbR/CyaY-like superfamily)